MSTSLDFYVDGAIHCSKALAFGTALNVEGAVIGNDQDSLLGGWDINA